MENLMLKIENVNFLNICFKVIYLYSVTLKSYFKVF